MAGIGDKSEQEFAAYLAPRLLGESSEESEMLKVVDFLQSKVVGGEKVQT